MTTRFHAQASILAVALGSAFISTPVLAQSAEPAATQSNDQLSDIVVTARRRAESLQDVPLTVTAFSAESIANKGIRSLEDVAKLTPGLFFDKGFVQQDVRPNIRGLPATRGRPPIGVLLDGIDISTESIATAGGGNLANLKLVDFERIEVVKGPQSALYGRVAFGGAINYVTKDPNPEKVEGYVSGEAGTYGLYEGRAAINLPLSDSLAVRVNGLYSKFNGFYDNSITGKRIGGNRSEGGAAAVKFAPNDGFSLIGRVMYSDDKYEPRAQYYLGGANGYRTTLPTYAPSGLTNPIAATGSFATPGKLTCGECVVRLSADPATDEDFPGTHTKNLITSLRGSLNVSDDVTISTWTGYVHSKQSQIQDADFYGYPLANVTYAGQTVLAEAGPAGTGMFFFDAQTRTKQFSQEVRIGRLEGKGIRWAVGGLYWWEDVDQQLGSLSVNAGQTYNAYAAIKLAGGRGPLQDQGRTTTHYSGYALLDVDVLDNLSVSAEGRYAHEKYDYLFARSILTVPNATGAYPFVLTGSAYTQSASTNYFAPRFSVNYKPSRDVLVYASFARGVKPAGLSQVQTLNPDDAKFGTEKLNSYELGIKSTLLNRRLTLNASIFRMDYLDKQESTLLPVPFTVNPQGQVSLIRNIGGARIDGAEFEAAAVLAPGLNATVGYTYLDARYTDFNIAQTSPITIAQAGGCQAHLDSDGATRCYVNLNGNRLEASSKHSVVGSLNFRQPLNDSLKLLLESDVRYRSKRYQDNVNLYYYAPYAIVDVRAGIETEAYSIILYCNNLFDNRTIQSAQSSGDTQRAPAGALSVSTYAPDKRQVGIRARYNF